MNNLVCLHATTADGITHEAHPEGEFLSYQSFYDSLRTLKDNELISCWATPKQVAELEAEYGIKGAA
jgi:hypothetical protein